MYARTGFRKSQRRLEREFVASDRIWVKNDSNNILSPINLDKIQRALNRGIIFGLHWFYYGGSSSSSWVCCDYDQFLKMVSISRPGDIILVWSVKDLLDRNLALAFEKYPEATNIHNLMISEEKLQVIRGYLNNGIQEFMSILYYPSDKSAEIRYYDTQDYDDFIEFLKDYGRPGSDVYVFPFNKIDQRGHILVEAKVPNDNGEIPIGGAY